MGYTRKYGKKEDWVSVKLEGSKVLEIRFARWESMVLNRIRSLFCLFFDLQLFFCSYFLLSLVVSLCPPPPLFFSPPL